MEFKENGALAAFSLPLAAKDILSLLSPYLKEEDIAALAVCHMIDEWIDDMCIHELCFVFLCGWFIEDVACPQGCPFFEKTPVQQQFLYQSIEHFCTLLFAFGLPPPLHAVWNINE